MATFRLPSSIYGAVQPSSAAVQIAGALLYAQATSGSSAGSPDSAPDLLTTGNIRWGNNSATDRAAATDTIFGTTGGSVATDPSGSGTIFEYQNPCCGGAIPNFFKVNGVGQTNGLQSPGGPVPDPQWPNVGPTLLRRRGPVRHLRDQSSQ